MRRRCPIVKILKKDEKTGTIRLRVESDDDLWHLYNIVMEGDVVHALTERREETASDKIRSERGEKKKMMLGIRVEKVEFHEFTDRLRILGVIVDGPQDLGSHHTLNIEKGDELSITKEMWKTHELERLRDAVQSSNRPAVIFISLEDDEAVVALLYQYGLKEMARIRTSGGKMYASGSRDDYYAEIADTVARLPQESPIVLCGPGFARERLHSLFREKYPSLAGRARLAATGQAGMAGIREIMKGGLLQDILEENQMARDMRLMEEVMKNIGTGGPATYGRNEVRRAAEVGAVETLLVLDSMVRDTDVEEIMRMAEAGGGKVAIVSSTHDGGKMLESLGGLAALLRYRL